MASCLHFSGYGDKGLPLKIAPAASHGRRLTQSAVDATLFGLNPIIASALQGLM